MYVHIAPMYLCCLLVKSLAAQVQRDHDAVKKDNDFIYNDLVPKLDTLESIPKMALAKPVQFPSPSPNFVDVFVNLLPTDVYQAVSAYNAKRDSIVSGELRKLQEATQAMNRCVLGEGGVYRVWDKHACTQGHTLSIHVHSLYGLCIHLSMCCVLPPFPSYLTHPIALSLFPLPLHSQYPY